MRGRIVDARQLRQRLGRCRVDVDEAGVLRSRQVGPAHPDLTGQGRLLAREAPRPLAVSQPPTGADIAVSSGEPTVPITRRYSDLIANDVAAPPAQPRMISSPPAAPPLLAMAATQPASAITDQITPSSHHSRRVARSPA